MQVPQHAILRADEGLMPTKRLISLGLVGALHIARLYAIVTGLAQKYAKAIPAVLQATIVETEAPQEQQLVPPKPQLETPPTEPTIAPPDFVIETQSVAP